MHNVMFWMYLQVIHVMNMSGGDAGSPSGQTVTMPHSVINLGSMGSGVQTITLPTGNFTLPISFAPSMARQILQYICND